MVKEMVGTPLKLVSQELIHFGVIACLFRQIGHHSLLFSQTAAIIKGNAVCKDLPSSIVYVQ